MSIMMLQLNGLRTPLYPLIHQRIIEEDRLIMDKIQAWRFFNVKGLSITDCHGKLVSYSGIEFEGSPRDKFWSGFFEPFLVAAAMRSIEWIVSYCREQNLDPADCVIETRDLLHLLVKKTYEAMVETDRLLRGKGYPDSMGAVDVSDKIQALNSQIDNLVIALTHRGKNDSSCVEGKDDILQLKPNIYGVGIDLKALWKRFWKKRI
jgi:hypothetical protein